jgi:hypothetical protein
MYNTTRDSWLLALLVLAAVLVVADAQAARRSAAPSAPSLRTPTSSTNTNSSDSGPVPQDLCRNGVVMSYSSVFTRSGNATEFQAALTRLVAELLSNSSASSPWLRVVITNFTTVATSTAMPDASTAYFAYDVYSEWSMTISDHLNSISTGAVREVMGVAADATALFSFNTDFECGVTPPTTTLPSSPSSPAADPDASEASRTNIGTASLVEAWWRLLSQ